MRRFHASRTTLLARLQMHRAIEQFESNLESARQLGVIYSSLRDSVTAAVQLDEILRAEIVLAGRLHGFKTFQSAESISQAFSLLGVARLWHKTADGMGVPLPDLKVQLNLLVDRRNKIAHEGDIDPSNRRWNQTPY